MSKEDANMIKQDIEQRITSLETKVLQFIAAYNIDKQQFVKGTKINPGIGTKLAFDSNGLILSSETLKEDDIPPLSMDKIIGLKSDINNTASADDVTQIRNEIANIYNHTLTSKTGCKVNVDEHGFVNGVSDLNVEDIPQLTLDKIDGLKEALNELRANSNAIQSIDTFTTNPGTGCKLTYDEHGRVINKSELTIEDLPAELLMRINQIDSSLASKAQQSSVDILTTKMLHKVDANSSISKGIYTKVNVDSNGLVTNGECLTKNDLPLIGVEDIEYLQQILDEKLNVDHLDQIMDNMESIRNLCDAKLNVDDIKVKANVDTVHNLEMRVQHLEDVVNNVIENIPGDMILKQLDQLSANISTLSGRIATIERTFADNK
jgi:hypothetical protein